MTTQPGGILSLYGTLAFISKKWNGGQRDDDVGDRGTLAPVQAATTAANTPSLQT